MPLRSDAMLSHFRRHATPLHGLPGAAYTDDAFWELECKTVFSETWVFAGFAHELETPGDVVPVAIAGQPVVLVRDGDQAIRAFHNVCRHRCLQLVEEAKNVGKLIRCPYHAWAYDLAGILRATPHFGGTDQHTPEGFRPGEHGLVPVRTHVWQDWIFVNLDGRAPDFERYAAPLMTRLDGVDFAKLHPIAMLDFGELATNWKFIMENFIEPYHVQFVHTTTTAQPLNDHYTIVDGNCVGSAVDLKEETGGSDSLAVSSRYLTLFPNFILGRYFPDQLGVYLNVPCGPGRMMQKRALYTTDGEARSADDVEALKKLWWSVHKEDHEICERMQIGRNSPLSESGGLLSPHWEDSVRAFQELVVQYTFGKAMNNGSGND